MNSTFREIGRINEFSVDLEVSDGRPIAIDLNHDQESRSWVNITKEEALILSDLLYKAAMEIE